MTDWQAAIAAYTILFMLAETEAAPVAAALAWTATIGFVVWAQTKGGGLHISSLFPSTGIPANPTATNDPLGTLPSTQGAIAAGSSVPGGFVP